MYSIPLNFVDLDKISLFQAYGQVGVYVLWNKRSRVKPLKIGEGQILQRFCQHVKNRDYSWPIFGVIAILGDETKENVIKGKIAESVLLHVADEINRFPKGNSNLEGVSKVRSILKRYNNLLKVHVRGHDPFLLAGEMSNKVLQEAKIIEVWMDEDGELQFDYPWHRR